MEHPLARIAALAGAAILFVCGIGWYLSMGLWEFSTQSGFGYLMEDESFQPAFDHVSGPFALAVDFEDPRAVQGKTLYRENGCTIRVTRVDNVTDLSCRIWFRADGSLDRGGTLVSACLPQSASESSKAMLLSSPTVEPDENWKVYLSNYDAALGERGNQFAVTIFCDKAPQDTQLELIFRELQKVTFERTN